MAIETPQPGRRAARLVAVWEPRPWWAPQLQHRLVRSDVAVRSYGRMDDLTEARPDVVIVDVTAAAASAVQCLADVDGAAPEAFVIAIVSDNLRPAEWRLRELGVKVVVGENIGGDALAQLCGTALRASPGVKERR